MDRTRAARFTSADEVDAADAASAACVTTESSFDDLEVLNRNALSEESSLASTRTDAADRRAAAASASEWAELDMMDCSDYESTYEVVPIHSAIITPLDPLDMNMDTSSSSASSTSG
eukprot:31379-Heterocapsa_arctica.AAC.1